MTISPVLKRVRPHLLPLTFWLGMAGMIWTINHIWPPPPMVKPHPGDILPPDSPWPGVYRNS
jgi:hypothetical protein